MNNYEFCTEYAARVGARTVLDFGCGAGQIVRLLRNRSIDARGCDSFYGGGAYEIPPDLKRTILPMQDGKVPFPDQTFDLVINNQVMEHVEDIDAAISEIARVLKPHGRVLSLFPDKRVWREGHSVPTLVPEEYTCPHLLRGHPQARWLWQGPPRQARARVGPLHLRMA